MSDIVTTEVTIPFLSSKGLLILYFVLLDIIFITCHMPIPDPIHSLELEQEP